MKINDVMISDVEMINSGETVLAAARTMAEQDVGFLPVAKNDRLIGVLTDRDIVLRVIAEGLDPAATLVDDAMTPGTKYCFDDEDIDRVADNMAECKVSRLPVMNRDKRLVGVVSIDDLAPPGSARATRGPSNPSAGLPTA